MSRHDPKVRLLHMRDFARKALDLTRGKTQADLEADEVLRLAVTHLLELVGEAAGRVPAETQQAYPCQSLPHPPSRQRRGSPRPGRAFRLTSIPQVIYSQYHCV